MFFITNRLPKGSPTSRRGRKFKFDLRDNSVSKYMYFCEVGAEGAHTEIGSAAFFEQVGAAACRQILLYVHGFNVTPEVALERAGELQALCEEATPGEALVIPIIWPTEDPDESFIAKQYGHDQQQADMSAYAFSRVFARFADWSTDQRAAAPQDLCNKRINILVHSMGNRVFRGALQRWQKDFSPAGLPLMFRNVFMIAADVVNETLEPGQEGALIPQVAKNVTVYHSSEDLALRASKAINVKDGIVSRRLGHTGPERLSRTLPNVYSVDCDAVAFEYDPGMGHNYFLYSDKKKKDGKAMKPGRVFKHLFQALESGKVALPGRDRKADIEDL